MIQATVPRWDALRTDETRIVENHLLAAGFDQVDAYRYNLASIRVRVIDKTFEGLSHEERVSKVEPFLDQLPESTQADIMMLFVFAPSELDETAVSLGDWLQNNEFDESSPSIS